LVVGSLTLEDGTDALFLTVGQQAPNIVSQPPGMALTVSIVYFIYCFSKDG